MRKVYELISISKSLPTDCSLPSSLVERLQTWADRNRNLTYDLRQFELVDLVDKIIEEKVISITTKNELIELATTNLETISDEIACLYKLSSIVDTITGAGLINGDIVNELSDWEEECVSELSDSYSDKEYLDIVERMISTKSVTGIELKIVKDSLSEVIQNASFESKLDYLCSLVKERKIIGLHMIDILDDETAMSKIHNRADKLLCKALSSYSKTCENKPLIVVSLSMIGMLNYDGDYYSRVRDTYKQAYSKARCDQEVENLIRDILRPYMEDGKNARSNRIIAVALKNAIVPKSFLPDFFDLVFDIYYKNFECYLPLDLYEQFRRVLIWLREYMYADSDEIKDKATNKVYKLIASTKQMILTEEGIDAVTKLCIVIVKLIDRRYWRKEREIFNPYLKAGYTEWVDRFNKSEQPRNQVVVNRTEFRSRWQPRLTFIGNKIYLVPPIHMVEAKYNYDDITIVVLNDNEVIRRIKNPFIEEVVGGYRIKPDKIEISKPLGKLRYCLVAEEETIYSSDKDLYRDFIVFDSEGCELDNNTEYNGAVTICYKENQCDVESVLYSCTQYNLGFKLIREGDTLLIGSDMFCFSKLVKPGLHGKRIEKCFVQKTETDPLIPVYSDISRLVFEANDMEGKYEVVVNDKPYKLSDLHLLTQQKNTIVQYIVSLPVNECGLYTIEVNRFNSGKKERILEPFSFIYDNELFFSAEKKDDNIYRYNVSSSLLSEALTIDIPNDNYSCSFTKVLLNNEEYHYLLPFDVDIYKIGDNQWKSFSEYCWIDDIHRDTKLYFSDTTCDGIRIYSEDGSLLEDNIKIVDDDVYKHISIGFLLSYKSTNSFIKLFLTAAGVVNHTLICYNRCVIDKNNTLISYTDGAHSVEVIPCFCGNNPVYIKVTDEEGQTVFTGKNMKTGEKVIVDNIDSFENYRFDFYERTRDLSLTSKKPLLSLERTFFSLEGLSGRLFKIDTAAYDLTRIDENIVKLIRRECNINSTYIRFADKRDDENDYDGRIIPGTNSIIKRFDEINPVEITLCSNVVDNKIEIYVTHDGDALLLNFKDGYILNRDDRNAPPAWYFTAHYIKESKK